MKISDRIDQRRLKELLHYDPETGIFTWLKLSGRRAKVGDQVLSKDSAGYVMCGIDCLTYRVHRLAWLYMTGEFPQHEIDHINRIKSDNRWCNLREATTVQNHQNLGAQCRNTSGHKGVYWNKNANKWKAQIGVGGKGIHLGYFTSIDDAVTAYAKAASVYHTHNQEAQCSR